MQIPFTDLHPRMSADTTRTVFACIVAIVAAGLTWSFWSAPQPIPSDLAQIWASARALLHHQNPYDVVGPGRSFEWRFPLLYPLTAVVALVPLAPFPLRLVDLIFVGLGFGLFTWAVTRRQPDPPALAAVVSLAGLLTLQTSQWSLLLTGAALVPTFGFLLIAKPTIGIALFTAFPHWKTAVGCTVLLVLSLLIRPQWPHDWISNFASAPHVIAPIRGWGGPFLLLALLKWRRADARLLLAMACIPHTPAPYETIPLFLIPQTWAQAWTLWALDIAAFAGQVVSGPYVTAAAAWISGAQWEVALLYLPCLAIVLLRPNTWSSVYGGDERGPVRKRSGISTKRPDQRLPR